LTLDDPFGRFEFGTAGGGAALVVSIRGFHTDFYRAIALRGGGGAGGAYMDGLWTCDDLVGVVPVVVGHRNPLDGLETGPARVAALLLRAWHFLQRNTHSGSRRNIAAHYDLGNDFFRLFLSPDLMYSAAVWNDDPADTLNEASSRKLELICCKL